MYDKNEIKSTNSSKISSSQKKCEFSVQAIINKIEKDMNEIISEIPSRIHKNKLLSVNDTIKILYKKINSMNLNTANNTSHYEQPIPTYSDEINKLKEDIDKIKEVYEQEVKFNYYNLKKSLAKKG